MQIDLCQIAPTHCIMSEIFILSRYSNYNRGGILGISAMSTRQFPSFDSITLGLSEDYRPYHDFATTEYDCFRLSLNIGNFPVISL